MGAACSSDKYKEIKQKYGVELTKIIVADKGRLFFERIINKLIKQITQGVLKHQKQALDYLEQRQASIERYYTKIRQQFDRKQPGGIKSYEQMSGEKIQDQLGYTFMKSLFSKMRQNIREQFHEQQRIMTDQVRQIRISEEKSFLQDFSNEQVHKEILEDEKQIIMKKGQMDFHQVIVQYQEYFLNTYGQKLKFSDYLSRLNRIEYKETVQNLTMVSKDRLITMLNLILSHKINEYIIISEDEVGFLKKE